MKPAPRCLVYPALIVSAAALLQSTGCASGGPAASQATPPAATRPATAAATRPATAVATVDAQFIESVERSSGWAIHMADLQLAKGGRKEVKEMAYAMKKREMVNLALLARERAKLGIAPVNADHHDDAEMTAYEERMSVLAAEDTDGFFIEHMLDQRRDSIAMINSAQPALTSASLIAFARTLPQEREKDIAELRRVEREARTVPATSRAARGIQTGPNKGGTTSSRTRR